MRNLSRQQVEASPSVDDVREFYDLLPYPTPINDLDEYRMLWLNRDRGQWVFRLFWPSSMFREDMDILVAGCGTSQAAKHALREPKARVIAIDISETSLRHTRRLKDKHHLDNLELYQIPIEEVGGLGHSFDKIVCTGVIHHLPDPEIGLSVTKKRMETVDDETTAAALDFIDRAHSTGTPFFVWWNGTHMHFRTHVKPESRGQAGRWQSEYHDVMIDHDRNVGELLQKLDDLGIAGNTIVLYSTDNGPHMNTWPDGGMTPFRNEKNSNWEGAYRVPAIVRWPGRIEAGSVCNEIISHLDWLPTFLAAAGEASIKQELLAGYQAGDKTFKVHLDGYDFLPYLTGQEQKGPREEFFYFSDDGDLTAVRYDNWKLVFMEQRQTGTLKIWSEPFVTLRMPLLYNLKTDPYERATITSNTYYDWMINHAYLFIPAQRIVGDFLSTFQEYPPRQKAASFTVDQVMEKLVAGVGSS